VIEEPVSRATTDAAPAEDAVQEPTPVASLDETRLEVLAPAVAEQRGRIGETVLEVRNLATSFYTRSGIVRAVTGVDFNVRRGEIVGLVGESGCGKSVTALSILGLVVPPGRVESGDVRFDGKDLRGLSGAQLRSLRGDRIAMIFQQPQSSLNPVLDVGFQLSEVLEIHRNMKRRAARDRALELLRMVGIPDPKRRLKSYPFEMSGGMAQRVMIAMALACEPEMLIADEPTTALDVTIQAQILDLMRRLQRETGTAIILITHDLGVVAEMCDRVAVMYAGEIVEQTDTPTLFRKPQHPYTQGLIGSVPILGQATDELSVIPGIVPSLIDLPPGCRFAPRCRSRVEHNVTPADSVHPELRPTAGGHSVRCWLYHTSDQTPGWTPPLAAQATVQ
jgi:oligopeptide/dipeptide ABC transporter ATP-binding protein